MECREWSIAHVIFDVSVKQWFASLKARLDAIQRAFGLRDLGKLSVLEGVKIFDAINASGASPARL